MFSSATDCIIKSLDFLHLSKPGCKHNKKAIIAIIVIIIAIVVAVPSHRRHHRPPSCAIRLPFAICHQHVCGFGLHRRHHRHHFNFLVAVKHPHSNSFLVLFTCVALAFIIYGLPPLPPTSSTRRLAIGGRRSAIGGICDIPLCLLTILTYHTILTLQVHFSIFGRK